MISLWNKILGRPLFSSVWMTSSEKLVFYKYISISENYLEFVIIMVHDIWTRPYYHDVLRYLLEIERVDSLGIFRIRTGINIELVKEDYVNFIYDPR